MARRLGGLFLVLLLAGCVASPPGPLSRAAAQAWGIGEVWCTEFAFVPAWVADAEGEARRFVGWLEGEPRVTRYAPFVSYIRGGEDYWPDTRPEANPSVFAADGATLTDVGRWYARPTPEW